MGNSLRKYDNLSLRDLAEQLHLDYYKILADLTQKAFDNLNELKKIDVHMLVVKYTGACEHLLRSISSCLHERINGLVPYVNQLHEKEKTGHNCAACSGACDMGHKVHFTQLRDSHLQIQTLLNELHSAALPLYTNVGYPAIYKALRNEMLLIDTVVRELLLVEEANLMPAIVQSQKSINVHS